MKLRNKSSESLPQKSAKEDASLKRIFLLGQGGGWEREVGGKGLAGIKNGVLEVNN